VFAVVDVVFKPGEAVHRKRSKAALTPA